MILLDTHVLVWAVAGERRLGRKTRALIEREWRAGRVAVSALTFWEVAQLAARGRLELPIAADDWRVSRLEDGVIEIPVDGAIAVRGAELGALTGDPVDRMIVATALKHRATLVTADESLLAWRHALDRHDAST